MSTSKPIRRWCSAQPPPITPAPTSPTLRTWSGATAYTCTSSDIRLGKPVRYHCQKFRTVPRERVIGTVDLDVATRLTCSLVQRPALRRWNPLVAGAVHHEQRP